MQQLTSEVIANLHCAFPELKLLVLIGSRATGKATQASDWDFAFVSNETDFFSRLAQTEQLRAYLAKVLSCQNSKIDLIDLPYSNLAMRADVANEGIPLLGEQSKLWFDFLSRTWRELEHWNWEQQHAA